MSNALPRVILIAPGHNMQANYQPFSAEPHCEGVQYPREIATPTTVYDDGQPFAVLRFAALDAPDYVVDMTKAGVYTAKVADVTVRLPARNRVGYADYNGQAVQPKNGDGQRWDILRYYDVVLLIRRLTVIT